MYGTAAEFRVLLLLLVLPCNAGADDGAGDGADDNAGGGTFVANSVDGLVDPPPLFLVCSSDFPSEMFEKRYAAKGVDGELHTILHFVPCPFQAEHSARRNLPPTP